ncbi:hypothetical protein [Lacisediminihabitans changchengi]|uniref:Uncharacterized protein n=1 Tax=Lacisediminihabitans changchengi TaxID=2787634 RepID=A0A934SLQ7_9MICO|nr:hypothetical protein [Lacisediminihabitans changchengi]MBK4347679.1 hypothetical protein [Lacisediminihabitans changchengi]
MTGAFSWVDLAALVVAVAALGVTVAIFVLGRRLSFRQQRERVRELEAKAREVLGPIRTEGLNSKVIVMNVARYKRGYDGSNKMTWRGYAFTGPEFIEIDHGGVEVITRGIQSYFDMGNRRALTETSKPAPNVIESGHIPWDWIEDIAPDGDEFDGSAIFFVRHRASGRQPYDYITYREGTPVPFGPNNRDYYRPLSELGTRRPQFFRDWLRFVWLLRQEKKMEAKARRGWER